MKSELGLVLDTVVGMQQVVAIYKYENASKKEGFKALCDMLEDVDFIRALAALDVFHSGGERQPFIKIEGDDGTFCEPPSFKVDTPAIFS